MSSQDPYVLFLAKIRHIQDAKSVDEFYQRLDSVLIKDNGHQISTLVEEIAALFLESLQLIKDKPTKDALYRLFAIYDSTAFVSLLADNPTALASDEVKKELKEDENMIRDLVRGLAKPTPPKSSPPS